MRGKPLDARGLSARLRKYDVAPKSVRIGDETPKGYDSADLHDAWARYLPPPPQASATAATAATSAMADKVCPHGMADGDQPDEVFLNGRIKCPQCRAAVA